MKTIKEAARALPIVAETDILVVGSGPAGLAAALGAAREGVKTMLVEHYGCFGGVITQVGVEGFAWYRHEGTTDVEGIGIEFEQRAKELEGTHKSPHSQSEALNAEMFKYVADQLVQEDGVIPLLHCLAVETIMEAGTIKGIITESKSGRGAILAQRVIDATGDADIAYLAGAPHQKTPKDEMLGVTVMFSCAGINQERFSEYVKANPSTYADWAGNWGIETTGKEDNLFSPYLEKPFRRARQEGLIPENITSLGGTWSTLTDAGEATSLNMVYMFGYDPTDVWDLTRAEIEGRQQAMLGLYKHVYRLTDAEIDELYEYHSDYDPEKSESDNYIDMATWGHFRSTHARLSASQSQHSPTWEYLFEWSSPVNPEMGSYHAIEIPFVFYIKDKEIFGDNPPIALIEQVQNAWINFARNGDPNHSDLPVWPQYNEKEKPKMVFNVKPGVENDLDGFLREKWEEVMG